MIAVLDLGAHDQPFFAFLRCLDQRFENVACKGMVQQEFRVELNADKEATLCVFYRLDKSIGLTRRNTKIIAHLLDGLGMN